MGKNVMMTKKEFLKLAEAEKKAREDEVKHMNRLQSGAKAQFLNALSFLTEKTLEAMATRGNFSDNPYEVISACFLSRVGYGDYYRANTPILIDTFYSEDDKCYHYSTSMRVSGRGTNRKYLCFGGEIHPKEICKFLRKGFPDFKFSYKKDKIFVCLKKCIK